MEGHTLAGTTLAAYRIERRIGHGGMGDVFLAHDERLDRPVALKVLTDRLADDQRFRDRLLRESRLAASLDHPNVVPIYDAGEADGRLFIAMRYVEGLDLKGVLRAEGPLAPARAVAIADQLASALDAAHRRGLVHRDVKPSNVLLDHQDDREHAYLADFGLTQSGHTGGATDGQFMGTVDYVAPEQIRGEEVDGRADQYALACLLFECLTGSLPFPAGSDVAAIYAHLEEPPPLPSERGADLPRALDEVLGRAMAKEPAERYDTCAALVEATREALGLTSPRARGRLRLLVLATVLVSLIVGGAALALALSGKDEAGVRGPSGTLVQIDARTGKVAGRATIPGYPAAVEVTAGGVWVADSRQGVLWRYDPRTRAQQRISSNGEPRDIAALGPNVYVAAEGNAITGTVSRYDAQTGARKDSIDLLACAVASGDGVVWAAGCPFVQRLSADSGRLRKVHEVFIPFQEPAQAANSRVSVSEMAVGGGSLWVLGDAMDQRMWQLDERTGRIQRTIVLPFPPRSAVVSDGKVWITDALDDTVVPVDIASGHVLPAVRVGRGASGVAATPGAVWVANASDATVSRVETATRRVVATIRVGGFPSELAAGRGVVWVTSHAL
jgi:YVTN family beta-propeller protein